ncbi:pyridoxal-phosphate dependent TrpB family enzyme [Fibrobacter succinogenes subsp. succinogenes S85]|jgi:tryptophan synthase beta chain|uniref:tryptophan synthase n=3 Tax=Fibrobacter TaxID=832 RepID=C9RPU3_FIBSS|nr:MULTISPECIES: TrpB-like pyridoxal phosphate-dependent enzyme [Fibrobacter]ACX76625.1 pyridoxal-phosphate dependent TrpB-like enzyme [Fibrobacter succinogenes subsp. succinogenes S85]ADL27160.1 pyridoxal-phosphate dependent TrpB family enzyme [Fibrobacter succinogenes subsp. succinogenes S85]OWV24286.1 TrpB-like pyridoxal-phosphate dependent enzyme [Fibrobacter sp. UWB2]PWJ37207.1 tryptophan synthase beta chain [Fibrobacter succinogenes subsp. elongatus]SMG11482.1 tryptophan synthase beta ch
MRNSLKIDGQVKTYLHEDELPKAWYNVRADMKKKPAPLLNPGTGKPVTFEDLQPVFCDELIKQELDNDTAYIEIPEDIRTFYKMYRPSPLVRAYFLEQALGTPAHIYYKFEGNNTSGSHKLNSAIAQAYYAKKQGLKGVTTETGAGQWGTALSMSSAFFGLDCQVYMVKVSYEQKPFRREVMRTYGASVTPSPSMTTDIGRKINAEFPGTTGSLGCAISEAVEAAVKQPGYRYVLGSVLNQVLLHQSVIGLETKAALDKIGVKADLIIGCAGGGSNLGGLVSPFIGEKLRGEADYDILAVEPASCPSFTRGKYAYDFCDTGKVCPLAKMYTLGSSFIPSANHAGGLRYHGMSSILSELYDQGLMRATSVEQTKVFEAAKLFAQTEGILPAPESSHAIRATIDEALKCKESGQAKNIVFGLTGTGYFDMVAYQKFNDGEMSDYIPTDEDIAKSLAQLPKVEG